MNVFRAIKDLGSIVELRIFIPCMAMLGIGLSLSSPYIALYCTSVIGISTTLFGILMAVNSLSGVVINSLIARRSDGAFDRKPILLIGTCMSALLYLDYLVVHNFWFLLIGVAVFGGMGQTIMPQIFAYSREAIRTHTKIDGTFATSTVRSMFSLGFLIGPLIGTLVLARVGYTGVLAGSSFLFVLIGLFIWIFLKRRPRDLDSVHETGVQHALPIDETQIRKAFVAFVLLLVASWIYNLVNPLFIVHSLHARPHDVGLVASLSAGLEIPIMLWLGSLSRRFSNHLLILCGTLIGMIYFIFLGITSSVLLVMVAQLLQATFVAVVFGNGLSYFQDLLPNAPGRAATLYANASSIGTLLGNLIGGAFSQWVGYRDTYWLCLALAVVAFVVLALSKQTRQTAITVENQSYSL